jgi:hypothetical protein
MSICKIIFLISLYSVHTISAKQDNSFILYVPISLCGLMGCDTDALEENSAPNFMIK